jgi:hypothetical protein
LPYFSQCLFESSPKLSSQTREHYCIGWAFWYSFSRLGWLLSGLNSSNWC